MTLHDDLVAAKALIDTPEKWGKGNYDKDGCMCAMGALMAVTAASSWAVIGTPIHVALTQALPDGQFAVVPFNDEDETTHADVMALFDRAIAAEPSK